MGTERPGLRAELWAPGRAGLDGSRPGGEGGRRRRAARSSSSRSDADLWVDRGLSYAAMRAWPRAISDFDRALSMRAQQRRDPGAARRRLAQRRRIRRKALADADRALKIAPDHSEALLERGFAFLARGDRKRGQQRLQQGPAGSCRRARMPPSAPRRACAASSRGRRRPASARRPQPAKAEQAVTAFQSLM